MVKRKDTIIFKESTVEALVSRNPWDAKKVFVTGAGHLQELKNKAFVWESRKTGFCEGSLKKSCRLMRVFVGRASTV